MQPAASGDDAGGAPASPRKASKCDIVLHNAAYLEEHEATLKFSKSSLKFSGYAFLALAVAQTCQGKAPACLDSFAYGIFLLDAARRVSRLLSNDSRKSAQDQLTDALESIAHCHAFFAWVTAMLVGGVVLEASGAQDWALRWAEDHDALNRVLGWNDTYFYSFKAGLGLCGALGLRPGGYDYVVARLKYWGRASRVGKEMVAHKIEKVLSPQKPKRTKAD